MTKTILLGHGSGGLMTSDLIRDVFVKNFSNPALEMLGDSAVINIPGNLVAFTTDSFVVDPVFFPGGNIGKLAVCGTVNDLSVAGARPLFLSSAFIIEEGFPVNDLEEIVRSMRDEAKIAGISIVTGDTKVVKRGQCDKIFITTSGIGIVTEENARISSGTLIKPGDQLLVNGYLGDHEIAILAARENLSFESPVYSDADCLNQLIGEIMDAGIDIRFMRDITRGGLATVLSEIAGGREFGISIDEHLVPVREQVNGICEIYGFNPLYLANEGKVLMVVSSDSSESALEIMQKNRLGVHAKVIGSVTEDHAGKVLMKSVTGGTRLINKLAGEQLPRIC